MEGVRVLGGVVVPVVVSGAGGGGVADPGVLPDDGPERLAQGGPTVIPLNRDGVSIRFRYAEIGRLLPSTWGSMAAPWLSLSL